MSEIRKVVGVFDQLVSNKSGISFPSVRVWIRGSNDYETHELDQHFPDRGTIFLHVSTCENIHPQRNQAGLFQCIESPGQSANWKVLTTSRCLAKVIDCPISDRKSDYLAFWEWLTGFRDTSPCNILLSQQIAYVRRSRSDLVGPFVISPEGKLNLKETTFLFEGIEALSVEIGGKRFFFIDTELLPKGKPLLIDPKDAIHRRLKLVNKSGGLEWLSRARVSELSAALSDLTTADGSEWVMENLPRALESLGSAGNVDAKVADAILQIKSLETALEAAWKRKHADLVNKAEEGIVELKKTATKITQAAENVKADIYRLQTEKIDLENVLLELNKKITAAKTEAQNVFEAELKRLAKSPETMALMGAWIGGSNKMTDRSQPVVRIQRLGSEHPRGADFKAALFNNLKSSSLTPLIATELTTVCRAALAVGQPIAIKSVFADQIADAAISALGNSVAVWADVPAGLLDPVDWGGLISDEQKEYPLILQNVNRSDIQLVLGSLRSALQRQVLGGQKTGYVVFLTLESNAEMQAGLDYPFGPIIDDRVLKFSAAKAISTVNTYPDFVKQLPDVAPVSAEEFAELGDTLCRLPIFALSAHEIIFRRAFGALRALCDHPADIPRLFFKYWCLPRISPDDLQTVLTAYKDSWGQDKSLIELREALDRNE